MCKNALRWAQYVQNDFVVHRPETLCDGIAVSKMAKVTSKYVLAHISVFGYPDGFKSEFGRWWGAMRQLSRHARALKLVDSPVAENGR